MPITRKTINSYPEVLSYLQRHYSQHVAKIMNVPILEISNDLWSKFHLSGYGCVVRKNDILPNKAFLEMAAKNPAYYQSLPSPEHKRDVNIYRMWKQIQQDPFLIIREETHSVYFLVHELSHLIHHDPNEFPILKFNDEYLDTSEEQFAHMNEIRYAQQQGMTFDNYFQYTFPDAYSIIKHFEMGNRQVSEEHYRLAIMDRTDYKTMWDHVQKMNNPKTLKISYNLSKQSKILKMPARDVAQRVLNDIGNKLSELTPEEKKNLYLLSNYEIWIGTYKITHPYYNTPFLFSVSLEPLRAGHGLHVEHEFSHIAIDPRKGSWMYLGSNGNHQVRNAVIIGLIKSLEHEISHLIDPKTRDHTAPYPDVKNIMENLDAYYSHPFEQDAFDTSIIRSIMHQLQMNELDHRDVVQALKGNKRALAELGGGIEDQDYIRFLNSRPEQKKRFLQRLYQEYNTFFGAKAES